MKADQFVNDTDNEYPTSENPVKKKSWDEFRKTGLFLIINQLLHVFGWCLVLQTDKDNSVIGVFPARSIFRGFSEDAQDEEGI
jgi:hypothetical protein